MVDLSGNRKVHADSHRLPDMHFCRLLLYTRLVDLVWSLSWSDLFIGHPILSVGGQDTENEANVQLAATAKGL